MELVRRRKRLTECEAAYWLLQLLDATRYLHGHGIIHRDLKLGNLFIGSDMAMRVGDFGLATTVASADERKRTVCGTPNYIAPEILDPESSGGHSFAVDTWAIGVIAYTLMVGRPPFESKDVKSTYARIRACRYDIPPFLLSNAAVSLIQQLLQVLPADRPSLDEVLAHPFFSGAGVRIPTALPESALASQPDLSLLQMADGADLVSQILGRPSRTLLPASSAARQAQGAAAAAAPMSPTDGAPRTAEAAPLSQPLRQRNVHQPLGQTAAFSAAAMPLKPGTIHSGATPLQPHVADAPWRRHATLAGGSAGADKENPAAFSAAHAEAGTAAARAAPALQARSGDARHGNVAAGASDSGSAPPKPAAPAHAPLQLRSGAVRRVPVAAPEAPPSQHNAARAPVASAAATSPPQVRAAAPEPPLGVRVRPLPSPSPPLTRAAPSPAARGDHAGRVSTPGPGTALAAPSVPVASHGALDDTFKRVYTLLHAALGSRAAFTGVADVAAVLGAVTLDDDDAMSPAQPTHRTQHQRSPAAAAMAVDTDDGAPAGRGTVSQHDGARLSAATAGRPPRLSVRGPLASRVGTSPWVTTFIDFSAKYGLGYLLSNGSVGVYFNDSTRIVAAPGGTRYEYMERTAGSSAVRTTTGALATDPAPELKKKVTLLRHFRGYLLEQFAARRAATASANSAFFEPPDAAAMAAAVDTAATGGVRGPLLPVTRDELSSMAQSVEAAEEGERDGPSAASLVHVRKWTRTRRAVVFRLSCGAVQVSFFDGSVLVLHVPQQAQRGAVGHGNVVFLDRFGRREEWDAAATLAHPAAAASASEAVHVTPGLASPLHSEPRASATSPLRVDEPSARRVAEMASRLRYAHDVLGQLLQVPPVAAR